MALADINIRIGTEISQFQKGLRQAERELQRSADKFNSLGDNLSFAVSLPLAAAGVSALKAAGDIEALRLGFEATMTGAGKSTAEATAELQKLQKAAEAPGLDFEQAVKGSVRLQNVGFEAEQSRKILTELANAIALTGGNAQQLDGVTKQFAQIQGKGRILQEDLSIIVENMPVLSKVMKETFGTANAEGLRKLGISTEEFILKTTEGLAKLERVPGGLNNAFTNAGVSIKLALANVGESINKAFDVTGKLETFSTVITDLAAGFAALDPSLQKLIVGFSLSAAAAGPLFKIIGGGIEVYSAARSAVLSMGKAIELSKVYFEAAAPAVGNFSAGIGAAGKAWRALDTVAKSTVIGVALAAVVALGFAFHSLADSVTTAAQVQRTLNDVQLEAQKNMAGERIEAEQLTGILKSNTASYEEKKAALARLNQISPQYFGGLSVEKSSLEQINNAYTKYIDNLLNAARAQAAQSKIIELEKQRLDIADQLAKKQAQVNEGGFLAAFSNTAGGSGQSITGLLTKQIKDIEAQQKALADIAIKANQQNAKLATTANVVAAAPISFGGVPIGTGGGGSKPTASAPKPKADTFDGFKNTATGLIVIEDQAILTNGELEKLATTMGVVVPENNAALNAALLYTTDNFYASIEADKAKEESLARVAKQMETVGALGTAVGDAIFQASADGAASLGELAKAGANAARAFIAQQIAMGVAAQVRSALGTGLAGLILAPIAGAAAGALFNRLIPKFAEGGIVTGPTYGLVGEAGPEVIFPLSDLKKFIGNGGGGAVQVFGRLSGTDIVLSSERTDRQRQRRRGY